MAKNDEEVEKHTYVEDGENGNLVKEMRRDEEKGGNQEGRFVWRFLKAGQYAISPVSHHLVI